MLELSANEYTVLDWLLAHSGAPLDIRYPDDPPEWLKVTLDELIAKEFVVSRFHFDCLNTIALTPQAIRSKTELNVHHLTYAEHAVLNWMLEQKQSSNPIQRPAGAPDWFNTPLDSLIAKKLVVADSKFISVRSLTVTPPAVRAVLTHSLETVAAQAANQNRDTQIMRGTDARAMEQAHG